MQPHTLIAVQNKADGSEASFALRIGHVEVGRHSRLELLDGGSDGSASRLGLPSRFVSDPHARFLRLSSGQWTLEPLADNETLLNGTNVPLGSSVPVGEGDEIRIGQYALTLLPARVEEGQAEVSPKGQGVRNLAARVEGRIHGALLDALDLRRADQAIDFDSPAFHEKLLDHLDRLIARELSQLDMTSQRQLAHLAVYRLLSFTAISAGAPVVDSRSARLAASRTGQLTHQTLQSLLKILAERLDLKLTRSSLGHDLRRIDEGFDAHMTVAELDVGPVVLSEVAEYYMRRSILDLIFGLGPLQDLMEMESISEVMVVARDQIFIEKAGQIEEARREFATDDSLMTVIQRIVAPIGRRVDQSSPLVDAHLPDGSRVNAVIPPLALKGPALTIRKFRRTPLTIDDLVGFGALTRTMRDFLEACVRGRKNIVVSGGTGSGKTTLLNCLSGFIGSGERVVTVEDTAELQLKQSHVVTLESRPPNMEGKGEVSIRDLVKNALRMRPDRIVVGECRGGEALDMLQAMNTGHDGSMTTGHANSPEDMIRRLETMVLMAVDMPIVAIREQIVSAVDVIVQVQREASGRRRVTCISEVAGMDPGTGQVVLEDIFLGSGRGGETQYTGYLPTFTEALLAQGHLKLGLFLGDGR